jgi:Family of unknown function (DUF5335)
MPTQEIFRKDWVEFFHNFSRAHQGWLATVEVFGSDFGAQVETRELPFEGISADLARVDAASIALTMGTKPDDHVTHRIIAPTHIRLNQTEEGAKESLQIESADKTTTLVRLQSPAFPDLIPDVILE